MDIISSIGREVNGTDNQVGSRWVQQPNQDNALHCLPDPNPCFRMCDFFSIVVFIYFYSVCACDKCCFWNECLYGGHAETLTVSTFLLAEFRWDANDCLAVPFRRLPQEKPHLRELNCADTLSRINRSVLRLSTHSTSAAPQRVSRTSSKKMSGVGMANWKSRGKKKGPIIDCSGDYVVPDVAYISGYIRNSLLSFTPEC